MGKCSLLRKNGELEPEYENIHKLFQLSLILLYDRCSQNKLRVKVENQICNKISHKKMKIEDLIIVKEEVNPEDLIKKDYETDEEFSLRVLGLLKYKFKDLELSKDNATRASYLIQKNLYNGLEEMVNLQPFSQRAVLSLGLKPVVNLLGYYPPSSYSYLEIGTYFEIGYSTDFYDFDRVVSPVKLNFSLQLRDMNHFLQVKKTHLHLHLQLALSLISIP